MLILNNDLDNELLVKITEDEREYPMIPGLSQNKKPHANVLSSKKKQTMNIPPIINQKRKVSKFLEKEKDEINKPPKRVDTNL